MPEAQYLGSVSASGVWAAYLGGRVPNTVEVWTASFSKIPQGRTCGRRCRRSRIDPTPSCGCVGLRTFGQLIVIACRLEELCGDGVDSRLQTFCSSEMVRHARVLEAAVQID
jgi:hypothetical protein